jgi:hypothetical protein
MGELKAGTVKIKDGKVTCNGQELATGAQNAVARACRALKKR